MRVKNIFKNLAALFIMFFTSLSASAALFYHFEDTLKFISEAVLPENPTAYAMGGFFGASLGVIFSVILTLIFFILVFVLGVKIRPALLLFQKKERFVCKIFRILGYIIIIWFVYRGIYDWIQYKIFLINGLWYYTSSISTVAMDIIILESILSR